MGIQPIVEVVHTRDRKPWVVWVKDDPAKGRQTHQDGPRFASLLAMATLALDKQEAQQKGSK